MQDQLIFGVGRLLCALPVADIVETVRPLPVEPVAAGDGGGAVLGVAVIRGEAVPVVDTARLLGDPGAAPTRFITASTPRGTVAFAAGDVVGVRPLAPPDSAVAAAPGALVAAVGVLEGRPLLFLRSDGDLAFPQRPPGQTMQMPHGAKYAHMSEKSGACAGLFGSAAGVAPDGTGLSGSAVAGPDAAGSGTAGGAEVGRFRAGA
ncbi:chemotaxis protein CheW [Dactylosporangium sp. CA-139066]|uniref:chemotaxis protein CheW n=1 Tax=Dactylosporangium sp. CA-139066 TaxID=3239930 RepID=UPI003D90C2BA